MYVLGFAVVMEVNIRKVFVVYKKNALRFLSVKCL
jgi:hypothetical protein